MQNRPFQCPFDDVLYASALLRSGDSATAAAEFDKLLEQGEPDSEETYVLAALAHQRSADAARAVEICEQGLLAYPYSERIEGIYLRLPAPLIQARIEARLAALNGKVEAMTSLVRDIDNWPASAPSLVSTAEALLKRAVLAAPKNARARYEYGRCLGLQRRLAEAVAALEEALSLTSDADLRQDPDSLSGF